MPHQPAGNCPDCRVSIGDKHHIECGTAICVMTGEQRILHADDAPPPPPGLPVELDLHFCGEDVWTGQPHGAAEAAAYGLFVRPADPPLTGWMPCPAGTLGAVPDLDRLVRTGRWNPIRQTWELLEQAR